MTVAWGIGAGWIVAGWAVVIWLRHDTRRLRRETAAMQLETRRLRHARIARSVAPFN